jgi:hypothetical protein
MRTDALSQLLFMANLRLDTQIVVVESCSGLVIASILERVGGLEFDIPKRKIRIRLVTTIIH